MVPEWGDLPSLDRDAGLFFASMTAITRIAAPSHYANRHEATANGFDRGSSPSHVMRQASHAATSPRKAASSATAASTDSYPHGLLAQTTQWRFPPAKAALSQTFGGLGKRQCCGKFGLRGRWLPDERLSPTASKPVRTRGEARGLNELPRDPKARAGDGSPTRAVHGVQDAFQSVAAGRCEVSRS